jgi:hypothetical protein
VLKVVRPPQVQQCLPDFTVTQLGVLLWGWRSVQLDVPDTWERVFAAAAAQVYSEQQLRDASRLLGLVGEANLATARRLMPSRQLDITAW